MLIGKCYNIFNLTIFISINIFKSAIMDNKTEIILKNYIEKMSALPVSIAKILKIANNPQVQPKDLNKVISLDPVLMAKVLKLINSAYYGLPNKITSLVRAIIMLGINTVKNLALSTAVVSNLASNANFKSIDKEAYWRHSIGTGIMAKKIAEKRGVQAKILEEYFITGLLHDLGKIPLNDKFSEDYMAAMTASDVNKQSLYKKEIEMFGIDHSEVGALIAKSWKLSEPIYYTIKCHHSLNNIPEQYEQIVSITSLANNIINLNGIGFAGNRHPENNTEDLMKKLNLSWEILDSMLDTVGVEIENASIFLKISD